MKPSLPVTSRPLFGRLAPSGVTARLASISYPLFVLGPLGVGFAGRRVGKPHAGAVAATPVVLTDEDLERLPSGGPHKGMR
jgi:hypothetical protein